MYYIEVKNPRNRWMRTPKGHTTKLLNASSMMCNLVDSGTEARIVDNGGNVYAHELPHAPEVVWDDSYQSATLPQSGIVCVSGR